MGKKKKNGLLSSAGWNMLSLLVVAIAGFISLPIIINGIGTDNFGLYSIIIMIGGFVSLQDLGLGEATLRFVSKYYNRGDQIGVNRVLGATLSVYIFTGAIVCFAVIMFSSQIVALFKMQQDMVSNAVLSLRIASIGFLFFTIAKTAQKVPEAMQRYDISCKVRMVITAGYCVLSITLIKLGGGLVGLVSLQALKSLAMLYIYVKVSCRLMPGLRWRPHVSRVGLKEVFGYGVFSFTNQIIGNLSMYIDRLIMGMYFGASEVAYLTAPKDLLSRASGLTGAAGQALFPRFSSIEDDKAAITRLYVNSTWTLLCFSLVLFIPITILLPEFLSLWISPEFAEKSARVAQLIAINFSLLGATGPYFAYLKGTGKVHWLTIMYFISTGTSIILAIILIRMYGLLGAGIRVCLIAWTSILFSMIVLKKAINPPLYFALVLRSTILPLFISGIFAFSTYYFWNILDYHGWASIFLGFPAIAGMLAIILFAVDYFRTGENGASHALMKKVINTLKDFHKRKNIG